MADGARSDKGWGGRSRLPGTTPPSPNGGPPAALRSCALGRPPARRPPRAPTAAQPGRWAVVISGNGAGSAVDEPGGGAGGAPGRRAGGAGRHVRQWPGGAGRALLPARPLARATTIQRARRRAGTLNTRADKSFIFQSLTSLMRSPSAERSREDLGREPRVGRGGGMRGDSRHPRVDPSKGCACRPGPAAGARAALPSPRARPAAATQRARRGGVGEVPGDAERDEWRACPPEQAGSGEVGRGGEGGIRERRRRATGGPRAAGEYK